MRLNHFIAESGAASRRQADALIAGGHVTVNGKQPQPGMQVEPTDEVLLDGKPLKKAEEIMIAFHKPAGVVCSRGDNDRAVTVEDYLKLKEHLFPVGRLDKDSEGLLLLTNMGELAQQISRAGDEHEKEYIVTVKRPLSGAFIDRMRRGVKITIPANRSTTGCDEELITRPCTVIRRDEKSFTIILTEGKNRQIRRMTAALGNRVETLKRVRIMNIELGDLPVGKTRIVAKQQIDELKKITNDPKLMIQAAVPVVKTEGSE